MNFTLPKLYAIIDAQRLEGRSPAAMAEALLKAGVRLIQYRDKENASRDIYDACLQLSSLIHQAQAAFIVNDRTDIALAVEADGVHLGQDDFPVEEARRILGNNKIVGYSTHDLGQLAEADRAPVDYVAYGPVFPTQSRQNPSPVVGLAGLSAARAATRKPLVAIGGITSENAAGVLQAGADSVAIIQALHEGADAGEAARRLLASLRRQVKNA